MQTVLKDSHTKPLPVIEGDRTGRRTAVLAVMIGLRTNVEQPANRRAYNLLAEAIGYISQAEEFAPEDD